MVSPRFGSRPRPPKPFRRLFIRLVVIGIALLILPTFWIAVRSRPFIHHQLEAFNPAQAIVVLGARVYPDHPSPMLARRLDAAIALYESGLAPKILVSGASLGPDADEPARMKDYLIARGIPEQAIEQDAGGLNTYRSLARLKPLWGYHQVILATTDYHLPRSIFIARALGLEASGYPSALHRNGYLYNYARETLAKLKALYNVYIHAPSDLLTPKP